MVMLMAFFVSTVVHYSSGMLTDISASIPSVKYFQNINTEEFYLPFELGEIVARNKGK